MKNLKDLEGGDSINNKVIPTCMTGKNIDKLINMG